MMKENINGFLRIMLWLSVISGTVFGLGLYLAPVAFNNAAGVETPDPTAVMCVGGFLTASAVASLLALRSGKWSEARIAVYGLLTWNLLNSVRLAMALTQGVEGLIPNLVSTTVLGLGLLYAIYRQNQ